jgi:predicted ATPase
MGAAIDWSFDLLDHATQELFVQLGVFAGSFTLAAVEAVMGEVDGSQAIGQELSELVRASLLERVATQDGVERYRMLETVREYAADRLATRTDAALPSGRSRPPGRELRG